MYALVGGLASSIELTTLYILTSKEQVWYVYASMVASAISFSISFTLRKIWVFKNKQKNDLVRQIVFYLLTMIGIIFLNTSLVIFLVERLKIFYILAQFSAGLFSGLLGFVVNRSVTFRSSPNPWSYFIFKIKHFFKHTLRKNRL